MKPALNKFFQAICDVMDRRAHQNLKERLRPEHALSTDVYGRPPCEALDELEANMQEHVKGEILGIWFQGSSREDMNACCDVAIRTAARSVQGHLFVAAPSYKKLPDKRGDLELIANWGGSRTNQHRARHLWPVGLVFAKKSQPHRNCR